ncbi:MAG: hypothetical protein ABIQ73_04235 [Acidimicrobiales bacterium]
MQQLSGRVWLLVVTAAFILFDCSAAFAQVSPDPGFQSLLEMTQPGGFVVATQFPNVGVLRADALSSLNPDGAVFTAADFAEHRIGFFGWHWISTAEPTGSRRVINLVGLSSTAASEAKKLTEVFASLSRQRGDKDAPPAVANAVTFTGIAPDAKQAAYYVGLVRNDRAILISAFGPNASPLQSEVNALAAQLADGLEQLPSRVEASSSTKMVVALAAAVAVVLVAGVVGVNIVRRRRARTSTV